jgi:flagellar motility protein MotE (MotC chaperone)
MTGSAVTSGRIRFLPIAIAIAIVVLGLRVGVFYVGGESANAQQTPAPAPTPAAPPAPAAQPAAAAPVAQPGAAAPAAAGTAPAAAAKPPAAAAAQEQDVTNLSGSEIAVLQQLAARRAEIEKRSSELDRREAVLKAAEERIDAKIQELKKLQASVQQAIGQYDDQENQRIQNLVKVYQVMKPQDAARIFEQLDMPTLIGIAEKMNTRNLAPVLAQMNPVRAKMVTDELARRRKPGEVTAENAPAQPAAPAGAAPAPVPALGPLPPGGPLPAPLPPQPGAGG